MHPQSSTKSKEKQKVIILENPKTQRINNINDKANDRPVSFLTKGICNLICHYFYPSISNNDDISTSTETTDNIIKYNKDIINIEDDKLKTNNENSDIDKSIYIINI